MADMDRRSCARCKPVGAADEKGDSTAVAAAGCLCQLSRQRRTVDLFSLDAHGNAVAAGTFQQLRSLFLQRRSDLFLRGILREGDRLQLRDLQPAES